MKKNVSPLAVVAALVLVGLMIYGVFQVLTQTGSTANPETANKVPAYARQRGMVGSPTGGNSGGTDTSTNNNKNSTGPASGATPAASNGAGTSTSTPTTR